MVHVAGAMSQISNPGCLPCKASMLCCSNWSNLWARHRPWSADSFLKDLSPLEKESLDAWKDAIFKIMGMLVVKVRRYSLEPLWNGLDPDEAICAQFFTVKEGLIEPVGCISVGQ